MSGLTLLTAALGSLCLTAFYSGAETGFMSASRVRLHRDEGSDSPATARLLAMLRDVEDPILTCLIGTNLFAVLFTALVTAAFAARGGGHAELWSVAVSSVVMIGAGEILPKVIFREFPEKLTTATLPLVVASMSVLTPVRWVLRRYTGLWHRLLPADASIDQGTLDPRGLVVLLRANAQRGGDDRRFALALDKFLQLATLPLTRITRPLSEVVSVTAQTTVAGCLQIAARSGFSRLPVVEGTTGELRAYLLVRDLLFLAKDEHVRCVPRKLWRTLLLVDERMSPYELFEEFRSQGRQVAVVVDSAGVPEGLVTLEDLIERVVGSVRDEFDTV